MSTLINTILIADIRQLIDGARQRVAQAFNAELSLLYWQIGQRLQLEILNGERAEYGKDEACFFTLLLQCQGQVPLSNNVK
jgi:hypothetical protein